MYTSSLVAEQPMRWVSSLFSFIVFDLIKYFQVHASFTWKQDAYIDTQKCPFCEVVKIWNGLHHCIPLVETVKKTYMERLSQSPDEGVMPLERCSVVRTSDSSPDFWRPGLLTWVGTSDLCWDFWHMSGLPTVETADPSRDFWPMSGLLTWVGTSGRPNKKGCSDLTF
jgi:hypothetical protein